MNDREQKVLELWKEGLSTFKMSQVMGISKNSICGIVFRMRKRGIEIPVRGSHPTGIIKFKKPKEKKEPAKSGNLTPRFNKIFKQTKLVKRQEKINRIQNTKPSEKNVRFWKLTAQSCRYVVNDGRAEDFIFCGEPKQRGSYCAAHADICYMPPKVPNAEYQRANSRFK